MLNVCSSIDKLNILIKGIAITILPFLIVNWTKKMNGGVCFKNHKWLWILKIFIGLTNFNVGNMVNGRIFSISIKIFLKHPREYFHRTITVFVFPPTQSDTARGAGRAGSVDVQVERLGNRFNINSFPGQPIMNNFQWIKHNE